MLFDCCVYLLVWFVFVGGRFRLIVLFISLLWSFEDGVVFLLFGVL